MSTSLSPSLSHKATRTRTHARAHSPSPLQHPTTIPNESLSVSSRLLSLSLWLSHAFALLSLSPPPVSLYLGRSHSPTPSLAGGEFAIATGSRDGSSAASNNIMRWRQGIWQAVVGGTGGPVYALSSVGGCLYVGGRFSRVCASDLEVEIERESARASSRMCARASLV